MSHSERMSSVDTTWLRMDRPANPMMIVQLWILKGPVALNKVEKQIAEGHMSYRRYRQKVEYAPAGVYWRDDPNFDLAHHIKRMKLPGRGGKPELKRFVGDLASQPLDFNHPLWTVHIIEKYEGARLWFSLASRDGRRRGVGWRQYGVCRWAGGQLPSRGAPGRGRRLAADPDGPGRRSDQRRNPGVDRSSAQRLVSRVIRCAPRVYGAGVAAELGWLLVMSSDSATRFKGKPNGSKRVAWCEPLKLPEVKAASRALGCSINDMLLSCVAGAMRRYLAEKGDRTEGVEVRALVPIDLRQPGDVSLGNRFGIVAVLLPVGIELPLERLKTVRQRMLELKTSYQPRLSLGLFDALGYLPKVVQDQLFDLLNSKATAVMTNVPGPTEPLAIAGSTLKQWLFWVPQTGDMGMGVSIYSYAGTVQFGLITDAALTPDPEAVVSRFPEEFEKYL